MSLKSIDNIREWSKELQKTDAVGILNEKLDAVEREVQERYIALPVGDDGIPIHVGDVLEYVEDPEVRMKAAYIAFDGKDYAIESYKTELPGFYDNWDVCVRQYRPPTAEDILREFANVGIRIGVKNGIKTGEYKLYVDENAIARYAAKLQVKQVKAVGE